VFVAADQRRDAERWINRDREGIINHALNRQHEEAAR
jgi:hypothetical protein